MCSDVKYLCAISVTGVINKYVSLARVVELGDIHLRTGIVSYPNQSSRKISYNDYIERVFFMFFFSKFLFRGRGGLGGELHCFDLIRQGVGV